jgi:type II secretory ATPase GspE/PulE/Tfp pilus assembly ATPase PilB-like protein
MTLPPSHWPVPASPDAGINATEDAEKTACETFEWPTPPVVGFPPPSAQSDPLPCDILGLNERHTQGRLTFFVPEEGVAHVQLPKAKTTVALRFDQFQMLTLTTPIHRMPLPSGEPYADTLNGTLPTQVQVCGAHGNEIEWETWAQVENQYGLFLFPPSADGKGVLRAFIPRCAYKNFRTGKRVGDLLVESSVLTREQVDSAAAKQDALRNQRLGEILVANHLVTSEQLLSALEQQSRMPMVRIGDALVSLGMISKEQLLVALNTQRQDRETPLGQVLIQMGLVSKADLHLALSRKMGYPMVDLAKFPIDAEALRKLSPQLCLRMNILPLMMRDNRLVVAVEDPSARKSMLQEVEFAAQTKVILVVGHTPSFPQAIMQAFGRIGVNLSVPEAVNASLQEDAPEQQAAGDLLESLNLEHADLPSDEEDKPVEQSDNSLVRLINSMIIEAHRERVSDIHIECYPGRDKIRIRFRKDGVLQNYLELPHTYRNALVGRIKVMCDLDISERRKPQDGKINFAKFSPQHKIELRVATIPTHSGMEDVVLRILASAKPMPIDGIGLSLRNLSELMQAIERPYGLVLCVGPTGSGKTTTLHSALSHINVPERKIWTAEDPVEITQPGLRQVQVNPKIDWTFAKALRAFLRADPDVVMVGEMRDKETASMAVEASLTGHLVMSTLHTNSAPETVTRLLDMGLDPFNFADSLLAVLAQRLVRRMCSQCRVSEPATTAQIDEWVNDYLKSFGEGDAKPNPDGLIGGWMRRHARDGRLMRRHSPGCSNCNQSGYKGRAGVHELMVMSRELRHLIQTGGRAEQIQQVAMKEGMTTLRQDGIEKVLAGITTLEEVRATSNA